MQGEVKQWAIVVCRGGWKAHGQAGGVPATASGGHGGDAQAEVMVALGVSGKSAVGAMHGRERHMGVNGTEVVIRRETGCWRAVAPRGEGVHADSLPSNQRERQPVSFLLGRAQPSHTQCCGPRSPSQSLWLS